MIRAPRDAYSASTQRSPRPVDELELWLDHGIPQPRGAVIAWSEHSARAVGTERDGVHRVPVSGEQSSTVAVVALGHGAVRIVAAGDDEVPVGTERHRSGTMPPCPRTVASSAPGPLRPRSAPYRRRSLSRFLPPPSAESGIENGPSMALQLVQLFSGAHAPDSCRLVGAGRDEAPPEGRKRRS